MNSLRDGTCQVWWARRMPVVPHLLSLLDDVELGRLASLSAPADRERFVTGCAVTRRVLGLHLSRPPADVVLDRTCPDCGGPHGRVRVPAGDPRVHLSVSHSKDEVVVAFHTGAPVGVDVEWIDPRLDTAELGPYALTAAETAHVHRLAPAARPAALTTYWTRKEAVVKATGDGLRATLSEIAVSAPEEPARLLGWTVRPELRRTARLHDLHPAQGYVASLAVLHSMSARPTEFDADVVSPNLSTSTYAHSNEPVLRRPGESGQYTSIRYATRLLDAGAVASIGSVGDSYDNALPESGIGLYKSGCVHHDRPWRGVDDLELATPSWVHRFDQTRLHSSIGHVPPVEYEAAYYRQLDPRQQPLPGELSLHRSPGGSADVDQRSTRPGSADATFGSLGR